MTTTLFRDNDGQLPTYAWPGGYPLFYLGEDGDVFCPACANQIDANPEIVHVDINWEDPDLYCEGCSKRIESAYAEDEEEEGE
jgi:uncharacterized Zn finger protein (UPF0148 family)